MPILTPDTPRKRPGFWWVVPLLLLVVGVPLALAWNASLRKPIRSRIGPWAFHAGRVDNDVGPSGGTMLYRRPLNGSQDYMVWLGSR